MIPTPILTHPLQVLLMAMVLTRLVRMARSGATSASLLVSTAARAGEIAG